MNLGVAVKKTSWISMSSHALIKMYIGRYVMALKKEETF